MTGPGCANYDSLPPLSNVYLEDSYVLDVVAGEHSVAFLLDLVLMTGHPAYEPPPPGEQYCFRRGRITIEGARSVRWVREVMRPFRDATGEVDYGSIDAWCLAGGISRVTGDWGNLEIDGGVVWLELEEPPPAHDP